MDFRSMRLAVDNNVARLTFTDAERGNPIDGQFCSEFSDAAAQISERKDVRALLINAEGQVFSYGGDVASFVEHLDELPLMIKRWTTTFHSGIARLQRMDAPIVASVHGLCAGGMCSVVAAADIVVASSKVRFVAAYTGIGYACDGGTSVMLSRRMGLARTRRFLLLNESLSAEEAQSIGLCDFVVEPDELESTTSETLAKLANGPTRAYGEIRSLLSTASATPLETQLELEAQAIARTAGSADAREGIVAFSEKRKPIFKGE